LNIQKLVLFIALDGPYQLMMIVLRFVVGEKVIAAITQADVPEHQKKEAKSLLRKLLNSKAAAKVLGARAKSLAAKYLTE